MNMPRKLVHHGCCANYYFTHQRKYQNQLKKNMKLQRAYKQLFKRWNDLKSQNNEIIRQYQEQKVLNRRLEKELHSSNSVWMNHATSMENVQMKQLVGTLSASFENMLTHTLELTKYMSSGKSALDEFRYSRRNNWISDNRPAFSTHNDMPKPTSKTAPIRPMVQGYTVHQPSIFLQRCNVPMLEEESENDDSDRLPPIFEESESVVDTSPVSTNMMQEMVRDSINFVENDRKRKSRLGRLGYRNCNEATIFGGNSGTERNSTGQEELQHSPENFSPVMSNVINIRRRNTPGVSTSPSCRRDALSRCREPVVKLHKLDNISEHHCSPKMFQNSECHQRIEEEEEVMVVVPQNHERAANVDPLEGSSWMYGNSSTPTQRRENRRRKNINLNDFHKNNVNMSYVVDDDDDDDDDEIIGASPASHAYENCNDISSKFKSNNIQKQEIDHSSSSTNNQNYKTCSVVCEKIIDTCSDNSDVEILRPNNETESISRSNRQALNDDTSSSLEFTGFENAHEFTPRNSLITLNQVIQDLHNQFSNHGIESGADRENTITEVSNDDIDVPLVAENIHNKQKANSPRKRSPKKNGKQNPHVVENGANHENFVAESFSIDDDDLPLVVEKLNNKPKSTSTRKRSPRKNDNQKFVENGVNHEESYSSDDDVPLIVEKLKNKQKEISPRKRTAEKKGNCSRSEHDERMLNNGSQENSIEHEAIDCASGIGNLVDCSTITKRRKMRTPSSNIKNESSRQSSSKETPKESVATRVMKRRLRVSLRRLSLKANQKVSARKSRKSPLEKRKKSLSQSRRKMKMSQESNQNDMSTASNFDENGIENEGRRRRANKNAPCYKIDVKRKLRRSK